MSTSDLFLLTMQLHFKVESKNGLKLRTCGNAARERSDSWSVFIRFASQCNILALLCCASRILCSFKKKNLTNVEILLRCWNAEVWNQTIFRKYVFLFPVSRFGSQSIVFDWLCCAFCITLLHQFHHQCQIRRAKLSTHRLRAVSATWWFANTFFSQWWETRTLPRKHKLEHRWRWWPVSKQYVTDDESLPVFFCVCLFVLKPD